jgi:hypothetical protein
MAAVNNLSTIDLFSVIRLSYNSEEQSMILNAFGIQTREFMSIDMEKVKTEKVHLFVVRSC